MRCKPVWLFSLLTALATASVAQETSLEKLEAQLKRLQQEEAAQQQQRQRRQAEDTARNGGFVDTGNGTLRDTQTGLVWTQSDNGRDINWNDAKAYCQGKGMRLPTIEELAAIYNRSGVGTTSCGSSTCKVSPLFRLTSFWFWSGTIEGSSRAFSVYLTNGGRGASSRGTASYRALCVGRS